MEVLRKDHCSSQNVIFRLLLIGCTLTLTFGLVLTPQDAKNILKTHNDYRRQESASNMYFLHWNVSLQERADSWANRCQFKHERNIDLGENLYFDTDHDNDVFGRGLEAWHKEKSHWGYTSQSCLRACHFTQLVWGYTTTVGCSANVCPSLDVAGRNVKNAMLFVCYYYPRGNFIGNFPYVKGRPCSECADGDTCSDGLCISSGPISKLAPDFVKSLIPLAPITLSRSSHSFQAFQSLVQQFTSESTHEGHHHRSHHRSEHHHQQQHHFQSETVVSSGSAHSYSSQHSRVQQHHQQVYHSSQQYQQQHHQQQHQQVYHSSQQYQQQHHQTQQQHGDNDWLKEQDRRLQQEEKRRQDILEDERQRKLEIEKRQLALVEEQQKQFELDQRRQHSLAQTRVHEERLKVEKIRKEEADRQQLQQEREIQRRQIEQENLRQYNEERNRQIDKQETAENRRNQNTNYDISRTPISPNDNDRRRETIQIFRQPTVEKSLATESLFDYNFRKHENPSDKYTTTTIGWNLQRYNQDNRIQRPLDGIRNAGPLNHTIYDEISTRTRARYPSSAQGTLTTQSSTVGEVVKLLSGSESDNSPRGRIYDRGHDSVSVSNWSQQNPRHGTSSQQEERSLRGSQTVISSGRNTNIGEELTDIVPDDYSDREANIAIDEEEYEEDPEVLKNQRQRAETSRRHLRKKWMHLPKKLRKMDDGHPHKENYVMESSGQRCVDRHTDCVRWAAKCYKSSAVTISCPMTCGKCGLHLVPGEVQDQESMNNGNSQQNGQDGTRKTTKPNKQGKRELTPAERRARRHQRRLEQDKPAPLTHPGPKVVDKKQVPRRTKEERQRLREQRRQERQQKREQKRRERQNKKKAQERQPLCRDDPKHIKSCKYWAKKGFCMENKLIGNLYCRQSCGACT